MRANRQGCADRWAGCAVGALLLVVLAGCGGSAPAFSTTGLVRWPVSLSVSADGPDPHVHSPDGRWWLVVGEERTRQPSDLRLIDTVAGTIRKVPSRRSVVGPLDPIDDRGRQHESQVCPFGGAAPIDASDGYRLCEDNDGFVTLQTPGSTAIRTIARGYPVQSDEGPSSASGGTVSDDGRYVTVPTTIPYAAGDHAHSLDVYQLDRRTGRWTRVTEGGYTADGGVSASPSGRYVALGALLPGDAAPHDAGQVLRWDRTTGSVVDVSVAPDGTPADDYSLGDMSVSDTGIVSFVSASTNLLPGARGTYLYTTRSSPG